MDTRKDDSNNASADPAPWEDRVDGADDSHNIDPGEYKEAVEDPDAPSPLLNSTKDDSSNAIADPTLSEDLGDSSDCNNFIIDLEKYKEAVEALMPDAKGLIHKDKLMEYFQRTLGSIVDNEALEKMEADENGMINIENFMADSLQSMRELLENEPAMVENMVDWKKILANIGLNVTDDDASEVFEKAKNIALRLIADKLNGEEEDGNKNETNDEDGKILQAVKNKLYLLGFRDNQIAKNEET